MAAREDKKKISNVAKMVKTFLKRKIIPKSPTPEKTKAHAKARGPSRPSKANKTQPQARKAVTAAVARKPVGPVKVPVGRRKNGRAVGMQKQMNGAAYSPAKVQKSHISGPRYFFNTDIPDSYNETYMRAMPRDPQWLFAYWEISESTRKELQAKMGESAFAAAKRILRLIDVTDMSYDGSNAQRYVDIEINEFANNWYAQVPESGRSYVLELGFLSTTGRFYCAARSNGISVPRMGVSPVQDEEWATVSTDELIRMSSDAMGSGMGSSERRFAAAETLVGHAGLLGNLGSGSGSGGLGDFSSGARY